MLRRCFFYDRRFFQKLYYSTAIESNPKDKIIIERTINKDDVRKFAELTGDFNNIHFGDNSVVHGTFLNGLVSGVIGTKLPGPGTLVLSQTLQYPNPCPVGATVSITVEIKSWRKIIICEYNVRLKENDIVVFKGDARLIKKKS